MGPSASPSALGPAPEAGPTWLGGAAVGSGDIGTGSIQYQGCSNCLPQRSCVDIKNVLLYFDEGVYMDCGSVLSVPCFDSASLKFLSSSPKWQPKVLNTRGS